MAARVYVSCLVSPNRAYVLSNDTSLLLASLCLLICLFLFDSVLSYSLSVARLVNVSVKVSGPTHCRAPPPTPPSTGATLLSSVIVCIRQASDSVVCVYDTRYTRRSLRAHTCLSRASLPFSFSFPSFFLSFSLSESPLLFRSVSFSLFVSVSLSRVSSSRQPRCIPRGSPLDIVAPRRLVRISLLPCLFFFPFYRFSIARCLFPHLVAPISLAHRDAFSLTDRIEPFIPSSRILGSITRVSPFHFPPSLPPCFVFVRSVHPVWSCSPQHIATVHSVETSTRYRYAALHPCVTGYLISPFLSLSPPPPLLHIHIHILSLFLSGFFFSRLRFPRSL